MINEVPSQSGSMVSTHDTSPKCFPIIIGNDGTLSGWVDVRLGFFEDRTRSCVITKIISHFRYQKSVKLLKYAKDIIRIPDFIHIYYLEKEINI